MKKVKAAISTGVVTAAGKNWPCYTKLDYYPCSGVYVVVNGKPKFGRVRAVYVTKTKSRTLVTYDVQISEPNGGELRLPASKIFPSKSSAKSGKPSKYKGTMATLNTDTDIGHEAYFVTCENDVYTWQKGEVVKFIACSSQKLCGYDFLEVYIKFNDKIIKREILKYDNHGMQVYRFRKFGLIHEFCEWRAFAFKSDCQQIMADLVEVLKSSDNHIIQSITIRKANA